LIRGSPTERFPVVELSGSSADTLGKGPILFKRSLVAVTALLAVLAVLTCSPAFAAEQRGATPDAAKPATTALGPEVVRVSSVPSWVQVANANADWKWLKGGWEIKFTKRETLAISINAGLCSAVLSLFSHPVFRVLAAACGILTWYSSTLVAKGRCLNAFVPLGLTGRFSLGSRAC
jgi:hypothetical protein